MHGNEKEDLASAISSGIKERSRYQEKSVMVPVSRDAILNISSTRRIDGTFYLFFSLFISIFSFFHLYVFLLVFFSSVRYD